MAYNFNGSTQYISGNNVISAFGCTFSAIGRCTRLTNYNTALAQGYSIAAADIQLVWAGADAGDPIAAYVVNGAFPAAKTGIAYSANTWHNGVGTYGSTTARSAYIDGGNSGSDTNTVSLPALNRTAIAATFEGAATNFFSGDLCECAIWNVVLTTAEIASLGKGFKPSRIRPQSLVFYAPLIRNIQDVKAALSLTNNNSATVSNHPRVY